ncbi:MAG: Rieske (2Fe-2S) protein [Planctomycetes bacterium]|nr:Rieske (2Fe-2S) protein [Planctomycetota bacterium]
MRETWIPVRPVEGFELGAAEVVKGEHEGRRYQIVVFHAEPERYHAVDNLCPHEGYPLVQGYVKDCVLTCAWHNFKFRLEDGACLKGDEAVTVYATRVQGGVVEVRLRAAARAIDVPATFASLREGLLRGQMARVTRDAVRLLQARVPAEMLLLAAARFDAERAEWGATHALAVAADMLGELERFEGLEQALPVMQALELAADPNRLRPLRALAEPVAPPGDAEATFAELRAAVEGEDAARAEALLRGALAAGWGREVVEPWFLRLTSDHFLGFGHALIYVTKGFDLIERVGFDYAEFLLPALLFRIVNSTREDTLPPMLHVEEFLAPREERLGDWRANAGPVPDAAGLRAAVLDGGKHQAREAVAAALDAGAAPRAVLDELARCAAERMLRFDAPLELRDDLQDGWLDLTHALTYAHAIREALERCDHPRLLRHLFFAAHFVQRTAPLDAPERPREPAVGAASVADVTAAVAGRRAEEAVALARRYLADGGAPAALRDAFMDWLYADALILPIVVAHGLKTCLAAFAEREALGGDPSPVLAFTRLAASPLRERDVSRMVHEAIRFLDGGQPPRRLTL